MGLFSFFKRAKKDNLADVDTKNDNHAEFSLNVTVKTHWVDDERVRPNGLGYARKNGYGNYLLTFTPESLYTVYGTNPQTNRKNKRQFKATSEADIVKKAEADGLIAPFEITLIETYDAPAPTERQLEYAKDMDVRVPDGACKWDVSALLSRYEENDPEPAPKEYLDYLEVRKWGGSSLVGKRAAFRELFWTGELRDRLAMYAYFISQSENGGSVTNLDTDAHKAFYYSFADFAIADPKIVGHFYSWCDDGSYSTQRTWGIYKDYSRYREANHR